MPTTGTPAVRQAERIALGSGHLYVVEETSDVCLSSSMTIAQLLAFVKAHAVSNNTLGKIKNGATFNYSGTFYTEKDDFGEVSKSLITDESASISAGLITFDLKMIKKLVSTSQYSSDDDGNEMVKLGGEANTNGKKYIIIFVHEDKVDGDIIVAIRGNNTASIALAFNKKEGSLSNPQFTADPIDSSGVSALIVTMAKGTTLAAYDPDDDDYNPGGGESGGNGDET